MRHFLAFVVSLLFAVFIAALESWIRGERIRWRSRWFLRSTLLFLSSIYIGGIMVPEVVERLTRARLARYAFEASAPWTMPSATDCWLERLPVAERRGCALSGVPATSTYGAVAGDQSMAVPVSLDGTPDGRSKGLHQGEIFVELRSRLPAGYAAGDKIDLSLLEVNASATVPKELVSNIALSAPSYLQMFFETCDSSPVRLTGGLGEQIRSEGRFVLTHRLPWSATDICRLGVKFGLNDQDTGIYRGTLYIDEVDWSTWPHLLFRFAVGLLASIAVAALALLLYRRRDRLLPSRAASSSA